MIRWFVAVFDLDDCSQSPCVNGGTCVDGVKQYTSNCTQGYQGNQCEIKAEQKEESLGLGGMLGAGAVIGAAVTAASVALVKGVQLLKSKLGRSSTRVEPTSGKHRKPGMDRSRNGKDQVKDGDESKAKENKDDAKSSGDISENEKGKKRKVEIKDGNESKEIEIKDDNKMPAGTPANQKAFLLTRYTDYITAEITQTDKAKIMKHTRVLKNVQPEPPKSCPPIEEILK